MRAVRRRCTACTRSSARRAAASRPSGARIALDQLGVGDQARVAGVVGRALGEVDRLAGRRQAASRSPAPCDPEAAVVAGGVTWRGRGEVRVGDRRGGPAEVDVPVRHLPDPPVVADLGPARRWRSRGSRPPAPRGRPPWPAVACRARRGRCCARRGGSATTGRWPIALAVGLGQEQVAVARDRRDRHLVRCARAARPSECS